MKLIRNFSVLLSLMILIPSMNMQASSFTNKNDDTDTTKYSVYTGLILDAEEKTPLPFATIECEGLNIATVSNIDGEFILKIPKEKSVEKIKISYIGYKNMVEELARFKSGKTEKIFLTPTSVNLKEVTVRIEDAQGLIGQVLSNIRNNYSMEDMMMTAFYRETIKRKRNYVSISEAVVDIYKSAYNNEFRDDQAKLIQGRKSADVEKMDTVLFKIQGGPVTTLMLDVVKNPYILLSEEYYKIYNFHLTGVISMNDRLHYVVSFNQKSHVTAPFYNGKLYIDMDKLAITEAEFELNMDNEVEVAEMFIRKKPASMTVIPEKAAYRVKYTITDDNKWYFSYARGEVKFNVDWEKKLFNTSYSTMSEIAITDRSDAEAVKFPAKERFRRSQVLDEVVYVFFDQDFWGSYNVIEPDQSIETAIKRLNRKFMKNENE